MDDFILQTKLYTPPLRSSLVPRAKLMQQMENGRNGRLWEMWLVQAVAQQQLNETELALAFLSRCLRVTAQEKYVRPHGINKTLIQTYRTM